MTITQRILAQVGLGVGLVVAVATAMTYRQVFQAAKEQRLSHLSDYVVERARVEENSFLHMEENLEMVRANFLKRIIAPPPSDLERQWDYWIEKFPDGAWRTRKQFSDGRKYASGWIHRDTKLTTELKWRTLLAQNISNELLPGWVDSFPSVYFVFPEQVNMGFDPRIPNWVWEASADYDNNVIEPVRAANLTNNPSRQIVWGPSMEEPVTKVPYIAVLLPVDLNGTNLGVVGHDIQVSLLLKDSTQSRLTGARHFIFRTDGRVIAHPDFKEEIHRSNGQFAMQHSGNPVLKSLYAAASANPARHFIGYDKVSDAYYAVARLKGPEWLFMTTLPQAQLRAEAFRSAQWVLWSGLFSLALVLGVFAVILRRQIARPLKELTRATTQMSAGDTTARAAVSGEDELGRLAAAFNNMVARVAARGAELRTSEQRWRALVEQSPLSVQIFGADGHTLLVNAAYEKFWGVALAALKNYNVLHDAQLDTIGVAPFVRRAFAGEVVQVPAVRYDASLNSGVPGPDRIKWLSALLYPLLDEAGRVREVICVHQDITERKNAEDKIRALNQSLEQRVVERTAELTASEARFRTLVENAPEAIVVLDAGAQNGVFVDVNRNAEQLFGLSRTELLKVGPAQMSPPVQPDGTDSATLAREKIAQALRGGTPTFEWTHRTANGVDVACEIRLVQLPSPGRNLVRGSITDITERKRAEKRRAIFAGLGQRLSGAATVEQAMQIALEVADELFGWDSCSIDLYSTEQNATFAVLTMDTIDDQRRPVPPAYAGAAPSPFMRKTIEQGAQLILRQPGERPAGLTPFGDKSRPSASLMFVPMRNGPRVTAILSLQSYTPNAYTPADLQIFQGLADYCSAAVERIQAEQEFRAIFQNSLEGICRTTREGRLLVANPAFAQMLGFRSPEEMVNTLADVGKQACVQPAHWEKFLADLAGQSVIREFDTEFHRPDGGRIHVTCSGQAVRDARGNIRYLAITAQDITERKRAEAELLRALAREKELGELKGNFIAMVSHEFRTPLEVIVSSADILNRYLDRLAPEERAGHLASIQSSVQRMAGMMEDVLLLGRFERGRFECHPDDLHLAAWCRRFVDEMRSATGGQCPIQVQLALPDPMVRADEKLLRHILTNLISNAVKYSPPGSPVDFRVWRVNGEAIFEITDRGRGIPPEDQPHIFEAFHRARNVGQVPGTGLGLVIVKRGVDLHGGNISVASEEGRGTKFTVRLPLFDHPPVRV